MFFQETGATSDPATDVTTDAVGAVTDAASALAQGDLSVIEQYLDDAKNWAINEGPGVLMTLLGALAIFVIGRWIARMLRSLTRKIMAKRKVDETLVGFVSSLVYMGLMAFVIVAVLGQLSVDTTGFVAIIGAATFAIGFALQGSLGNFAAGVMMMIFRPFKVGDFIEGGGTSGIVEEVGVFATMIRTGDNKQIIVPNGAITSGNIVNYSTKPTRRVDLVLGVGYDDDLKQARQLIDKMLEEHELVLKDPAPTVGVLELADSSVNFAVRPWVNTADYWTVYFDLHEQFKLRCDAAGISIPFPQRDVHLHQVEGAA